MPVEDRIVVIVTFTVPTWSGSHGLRVALLLASPEYTAFHENAPAELNACGAEFGTTPPVTVTGVPTVTAVPAQVEPVKNSYVTVPLELKLHVRAAESVTEPPTVIVVLESVVAIVGLALLTVRGSHRLVAPLLLASPL